MTDNVTNMLLAQRLMARLHPPKSGWSAEDQRRLEAQRREEEERRSREELRRRGEEELRRLMGREQREEEERRLREELRRRGEEELRRQMGMVPNDRVGFSSLSGPPRPPGWFSAIQGNGWHVDPPQPFPDHWSVPPVPRYDLPRPNFGPLNEPLVPPIPGPTYPGQTLPPPPWPPYR